MPIHTKYLLKTKCPHSNGSLGWKDWMGKALTFAVNSQMQRYLSTQGREGVHPEWNYTIVFKGGPPYMKAFVAFHTVPNEPYHRCKELGAVVEYEAADIFAGLQGSDDEREATI